MVRLSSGGGPRRPPRDSSLKARRLQDGSLRAGDAAEGFRIERANTAMSMASNVTSRFFNFSQERASQVTPFRGSGAGAVRARPNAFSWFTRGRTASSMGPSSGASRSTSQSTAQSLRSSSLTSALAELDAISESGISKSSSLSDHARVHALRRAGIYNADMIDDGSRARARRLALAVVHSPWFDTVIGTIVALNAICIGVEIQVSLTGDVPGVLLSMEVCFLCIYVLELMTRMFAHGLWICTRAAFLMDLGLVSTGVVSLTAQLSGCDGYSAIDILLIFRSLRIFRVVRAIRVLDFFHELWKLFSGLIQSCRTVMAAFILVFLIVYIFACVGVEIITKSPRLNEVEDTQRIIDSHFDTIFSFMLTLIQFANADSIGSIYAPIVKHEPALAIYFVSLIMIVTIVCMNLVTAAIVHTVFKAGKDDKDLVTQKIRAQTKKFVPVLTEVFEHIDTTGDGELEYKKLEQSIAEFQKLRLPPSLARILEPSMLKYAFEVMDDDGDGKVNLKEFVKGVFGFGYTELPLETTHMLELLRRQNRCMQKLAKQGDEVRTSITHISGKLDGLQQSRT